MSDSKIPIKVGIIGYGRAGRGMHAAELDRLPDKFKIYAVSDLIPERRKEAEEKHGAKTYENWRELVADPEVELVSLASRSADHARMGIAALDAGKNLVQEKPIATTWEDALSLAEAEKRASGKMFIRQNDRFNPMYQHIREIIASGLLGKVHTIKLCRDSYSRRNDWQTLKSCHGGLMLNWGPHLIDHCMNFLGWKYKSMWSNISHNAYAGDMEDVFRVCFTGMDGMSVSTEVSNAAAIPDPEWCRVHGDLGSLTCNGTEITIKYYDPKDVAPRQADPGTPMDYQYSSPDEIPWVTETFPIDPKEKREMWDEIYKAMRLGSEYPITTEQAMTNMKIIIDVKKGTEFEI